METISPLNMSVGQLYKYKNNQNPDDKGFGRLVELSVKLSDIFVILTTSSIVNEKMITFHKDLNAKNYNFFTV